MAIFIIFHPLQIIFIHYKSRIARAIRGFVVDEDDNGKYRLERVNKEIVFKLCRVMNKCDRGTERVNPYDAEIFVYKPWITIFFLQFEIMS